MFSDSSSCDNTCQRNHMHHAVSEKLRLPHGSQKSATSCMGMWTDVNQQ